MINDLQKRIIEIAYKNGLSHVGSAITALPILDVVYALKKEGEKIVLSSGHCFLAEAVVKEKHGQGNAEEIYKHHGTHPDRCTKCKIDFSSGSLGHGIGTSIGMAIAIAPKKVWCYTTEGDASEGSWYEALRIASENKVDNIKLFFGYNGFSAYKECEAEPFIMRLQSLGWGVIKAKTQQEIGEAALTHIDGIPICVFVYRDFEGLPFLNGIDAHYCKITKENYENNIKKTT